MKIETGRQLFEIMRERALVCGNIDRTLQLLATQVGTVIQLGAAFNQTSEIQLREVVGVQLKVSDQLSSAVEERVEAAIRGRARESLSEIARADLAAVAAKLIEVFDMWGVAVPDDIAAAARKAGAQR